MSKQGNNYNGLAGEPGGLWVPGQDPVQFDHLTKTPTGLWVPPRTGGLMVIGADGMPSEGKKSLSETKWGS